MRTRLIPILAVAAAITSAVAANAADPAAAADGLAALSWLAGSWSGEVGGVASEEHWTAPAGDTMLAVHRDGKDGRTVFFEFLRIEKSADGIFYLAQPKGRCPATAFKMVELGEQRVVFENRQHDYPQRILYWLDPAGALHARVEGPRDGQTVGEEWTWRRSSLAPD